MLCAKSCLNLTLRKNAQCIFRQMFKFSTLIISKQHDKRKSCFFNSYCYFSRHSILQNQLLYSVTYNIDDLNHFKSKSLHCRIPNIADRHYLIKHYCSSNEEPKEKLSLFKRFKQLYRDYWYVLVPVHLVTSTIWFTSFYYLAKSGVDIASLLEYIGAGEKLVLKLRNGNSTMGYLAVAYALYKIATPARYTVTLGGATLSIKYLKDLGYIKPIPPKDKIKEIIVEKKGILIGKKDNLKELYHEQKQALKSDRKGFVHMVLVKLKLKKRR